MQILRCSVITFTLLALFGCVYPYNKIIQPTTPFERPSYTIRSPQGEGWIFFDGAQSGNHNLLFNLPQKSNTHTVYANVEEIPSSVSFNTPQEFLSFFQKAMQLSNDPQRYRTVKEEYKLDNKFGEYSILHHTLVEDHGAVQYSDAPYLIMETTGFYFIHPYKKNLIINMIYSERGTPEELDKDFNEKAKVFTDGLILKK